MEKYTTAVIGGGAAGICAAIAAARRGEKVVICEKMPQIGKKLLATGNGRCNLLNDDLDARYYNPSARAMVKAVFEQAGKDKMLEFFHGLGLLTYSQEGRIFPVTNQASSVLKVLDLELQRLDVALEMEFSCNSISFLKNSIIAATEDKRRIECSRVIIAGGGKTYPAYGADGSIYRVTRQLGYSMVEPAPCAVPLLVKDKFCSSVQGQKIEATARWVIEGKSGPVTLGEVLFTQYGLSGTAILDISDAISIAMNREHKKDVQVVLDLMPFISEEDLLKELSRRQAAGWSPAEMLTGMLPNRLSLALKDLFNTNNLAGAASELKNRQIKVAGTRSWNEAEFTSGGIENSQINPVTLESRIHGGIYFAGEILDVNGPRGGYNLAWAWASGLVAGGMGPR